MLKTMLIDSENVERCKELLNVPAIADRLLEKPNWIIWTSGEPPVAWTLPHVIFRNKYTIVGHAEEYMIAERI